MPDYTASTCPICHKKFARDDEVVVCPTCGTPYHRECYKQVGHCVNQKLHESGQSWQPEDQARENEQRYDGKAPLRCSRCGTVNPPEGIFCQICGAKLTENPQNAAHYQNASYKGPNPIPPNPFVNPFGGVDADDLIDDLPVKDIALFVGDNSHYFLPRFKDISQKTPRIQWNWPALFFHYFYCFYRKMYGLGFLLLGILLLLNIPSAILTVSYVQQILASAGSETLFTFDTSSLGPVMTLSYVAQFATIFIRVGFGIYFNRLYYLHVMKRVRTLREGSVGMSDTDYAMLLAKKGRTNVRLIIVAIILLNLLYMGSLYLLSFGLAGF